jgi:pimeloyl-ACP methyl ester carboxylesterase
LREQAARLVGGPLSCLLIESYDNRASLAQIQKQSPKATIIIFHGERNGVIPVRMGRELAQTFPGIARFFPVRGADHVNVLDRAQSDIIRAMN